LAGTTRERGKKGGKGNDLFGIQFNSP
jgi:hypothetical protein